MPPVPKKEAEAPVEEATASDDTPTWPQGPDYDPREDPGPVRVEDK